MYNNRINTTSTNKNSDKRPRCVIPKAAANEVVKEPVALIIVEPIAIFLPIGSPEASIESLPSGAKIVDALKAAIIMLDSAKYKLVGLM